MGDGGWGGDGEGDGEGGGGNEAPFDGPFLVESKHLVRNTYN